MLSPCPLTGITIEMHSTETTAILTSIFPPRNPHPDSILWRSSYHPIGPKADILKEQAKYWGQKGIHYHQFLQAGENTLNLKLSVELYRWIILRGEFDLSNWLNRYSQKHAHTKLAQ